MQEKIKKVEEILKRELTEEMDRVIAANKITPESLKGLKDGACLMKDFTELEEVLYGGNSYGFEPMAYDGYSNRRGRSATTGRYISRSMDPAMRSYGDDVYPGRMTYDNGYSGHSIKDRMIARLETMYDEARTDHERKMVDDWIDKLSTSR